MSELNDDISRAITELTGGGPRGEPTGADDSSAHDLSAQLTGTAGYSDSDLGNAGGFLPCDVADQIEDYDDQASRRFAYLADDGSGQPPVPPEALQQQDQMAQALEQQRHQLAAMQMQQAQAQRIAAEAQRQADLEAQVPDFDLDPEGHVAAKFRLQELRANEAAQLESNRVQYESNVAEFSRHAAEVAPVAQAIESEFIAEHLGGDEAAYRGAFDHVFATADAEIRQRYPGLDEQQYGIMRSVASMAFLQNCASQNINPAQHVYSRAHEMGYRPGGRARAPGQQQRQPATMQQLANMSDKQFNRATAQPKQRNGAQPDVDRMSDKEFDEMFSEMARANTVGFGGV